MPKTGNGKLLSKTGFSIFRASGFPAMICLTLAFCQVVLGAAVVASAAEGDSESGRPPATQLLPENTLAFVSIPDSRLLIEKLNQTAGGKMLKDPQLKPLVDDLYSSLVALIPQVEESVGLTLDQMLRLPQGEVTLAVVPPEEGPPALVVMVDCGDQHRNMQTLVDRGAAVLQERGGSQEEETLGDVTLVTFTLANENADQVMYFTRDGTYVMANNRKAIDFVLEAWEGKAESSLADDPDFAAIQKRCRGIEDEPAQLLWFVDPIELVRTIVRNNTQAAFTVLPALPILGLDGLLGAGGSVSMATGSFDVLAHTHLLLDSPRAGVVKMLALSSGSAKPEPWVPGDVAGYTTFHWDFETTYRELEALVDSFATEKGLVGARVQAALDNVGVNFEDEVLGNLDGRITLFNWNEPPARIGSNANVLGVKLIDATKFSGVLDRIVKQFNNLLEPKNFGGTTCYRILPQEDQQLDDPEDDNPLVGGPPQPTFCLLGDYLLVSDRPAAIEKAILTASNPSDALAATLDYKLIASKIKRESGKARPSLLSFDRPEVGLKLVYDLVSSDQLRSGARDQFGENAAFQAVDKAFTDNPLPPFAVLKQYLAPGGAFITDDETGFHYMAFTLRRNQN